MIAGLTNHLRDAQQFRAHFQLRTLHLRQIDLKPYFRIFDEKTDHASRGSELRAFADGKDMLVLEKVDEAGQILIVNAVDKQDVTASDSLRIVQPPYFEAPAGHRSAGDVIEHRAVKWIDAVDPDYERRRRPGKSVGWPFREAREVKEKRSLNVVLSPVVDGLLGRRNRRRQDK